MKSIKRDISACLAGTGVSKRENYEPFVDELAFYVDAMRPKKDKELEDELCEKLDTIRCTVRKLARQLKELPECQRTCWRPYGDREAVAVWTENAIQIGERLTAESRPTRPERISPAIKYVAELWEKHFGKKPGIGPDSEFCVLFRAVFPKFTVDHKTMRKVLKPEFSAKRKTKTPAGALV